MNKCWEQMVKSNQTFVWQLVIKKGIWYEMWFSQFFFSDGPPIFQRLVRQSRHNLD